MLSKLTLLSIKDAKGIHRNNNFVNFKIVGEYFPYFLMTSLVKPYLEMQFNKCKRKRKIHTVFGGALDLNENTMLLAAQGGVSVVYKLVIIQVCLKKMSICTVIGQNDYHA